MTEKKTRNIKREKGGTAGIKEGNELTTKIMTRMKGGTNLMKEGMELIKEGMK